MGMKKEYIVELTEEEADELMDEHWVEELVRCKDCKYGERMCQPWNDIVCAENNATHIPEWFCADGERR